ncbi:MAG: hypothetical protein WAN43_09925 [Rhodomicrobium sp.]
MMSQPLAMSLSGNFYPAAANISEILAESIGADGGAALSVDFYAHAAGVWGGYWAFWPLREQSSVDGATPTYNSRHQGRLDEPVETCAAHFRIEGLRS